MMDDFPFKSRVGPYPDDLPILKDLGLPVWTCEIHKEVFLGEVRPYAEEEATNEQTVIRVYVSCAPAQFWRFEILRKVESVEDLGMETLEVSTGSGQLSKYWPMALAVANNTLCVTQPQRVLHS